LLVVAVRPHAQSTQDAMQWLPVEELHRHVWEGTLLAHLEGLHDVGMVQARRESSLVEEHRQRLRFVEQRGTQLLEDQELVDSGRTADEREVHVGHATVADGEEQLMASERDGWTKRRLR